MGDCEIPNPSDFGISPKYGFLSPHPPLASFTHPSYQPWDDLIAALPTLIQDGTLTTKTCQLPLLSTQNLQTELDYHRAYVVLGFLIHGYVWQHHHRQQANDRIPKQLAEPFLLVCDHLGLHPVLSYAGLCLWNWRFIDHEGNGMDLDNMQALATFTGTQGEEAFYHVPVLIEYEGGQLMHLLLDAARAMQNGDERAGEVVIHALKQTTSALARMGTQLGKLYARLDSNFFYHEHRPYMAGGKGMEEKGLKRGMVFEREGKSDIEGKFAGGSAVQSALFPFLDSILGVVHEDGALFRVGVNIFFNDGGCWPADIGLTRITGNAKLHSCRTSRFSRERFSDTLSKAVR